MNTTTNDQAHHAQACSAEKIILLCALQFEYQWLKKNTDCSRFEIHCTGPGASQVSRFLDNWYVDRANTHEADEDHPTLIMVGVAGALHQQCEPGSAWAASHVVSEDGRSWSSLWPTPNQQGAVGMHMKRILGHDTVLISPTEKEAARRTTYADLVDMESHALATWASTNGFPWGVIRGVSDGVDETLPTDIQSWTNPNGKPDYLKIVWDLISHPSWISPTRRLARQSAMAMQAAIDLLHHLNDG